MHRHANIKIRIQPMDEVEKYSLDAKESIAMI